MKTAQKTHVTQAEILLTLDGILVLNCGEMASNWSNRFYYY
jgi:hypothetical protein